jgi:hypothetical protein
VAECEIDLSDMEDWLVEVDTLLRHAESSRSAKLEFWAELCPATDLAFTFHNISEDTNFTNEIRTAT